MRLTEREAVRQALLIAIDTEVASIDAHDNIATDPAVILAKRRITAWKSILARRYSEKPPELPGKALSRADFVSLITTGRRHDRR